MWKQGLIKRQAAGGLGVTIPVSAGLTSRRTALSGLPTSTSTSRSTARSRSVSDCVSVSVSSSKLRLGDRRQKTKEDRTGTRCWASNEKAAGAGAGAGGETDFDENINPFCSLDDEGKAVKKKKSLGEMEQEYLDALRQFYMNEDPSLSDEEFDVLKDELLWEGSNVVTMTKEEQMFLEATKAYSMGKPILSDVQFNDLKMKLKEQGSPIASGGPRCSIRSRRVFTDLNTDYLRLTLLNIPAVGVALGALFIVDSLTGFSISKFVELPEPFGFFAVWVVVLPILYIVSDSLTKVVLKDAVILNGQCTSCGDPIVLFFGKVLGVDGNDEITDVQCGSCKVKMSANSRTRELTQITEVAK
jgi:hypothetical protein